MFHPPRRVQGPPGRLSRAGAGGASRDPPQPAARDIARGASKMARCPAARPQLAMRRTLNPSRGPCFGVPRRREAALHLGAEGHYSGVRLPRTAKLRTATEFTELTSPPIAERPAHETILLSQTRPDVGLWCLWLFVEPGGAVISGGDPRQSLFCCCVSSDAATRPTAPTAAAAEWPRWGRSAPLRNSGSAPQKVRPRTRPSRKQSMANALEQVCFF